MPNKYKMYEKTIKIKVKAELEDDVRNAMAKVRTWINKFKDHLNLYEVEFEHEK